MSATSGWTVISGAQRDLDVDVLRRCLRLHRAVWPKEESEDTALAHWRDQAAAADSPLKSDEHVHRVEDGGAVVAFARTFRRVISLAGTPRTVLALASVCSDPRRRGQGLGRAVVLAGWARLGGASDACLFQTAVPAFYVALGSRPIVNPIRAPIGVRPFWDPVAMIHPGTVSWCDGELDLCGPGW